MVIIAIASMYPILDHFGSEIIGWKGDNVLYTYMTGWTAQALKTNQSIFIDPNANYPNKLALPTNEAPFLSMLLLSPVTLLFGPIAGYNFILLISAFLSGLCMYLWVYSITKHRFGALIAGIILILSPYRVVRTYGHLNLISVFVIPLFFWSLDKAIKDMKLSIKRILSLIVVTFLVGSMSQYYLVMCIIIGVFYYIIGKIIFQQFKVSEWKNKLISTVRHLSKVFKFIFIIFLFVCTSIILAYDFRTSQVVTYDDLGSKRYYNGFSTIEKSSSDQQSFRWTSNKAHLMVPVNGNGSWVGKITLYSRYPDKSAVNGQIIFDQNHTINLLDSERRTIQMLVPTATVKDNTIEIMIRSNGYKELSSSQRTLGIGIYGMEFNPTEQKITPFIYIISLILLASALFTTIQLFFDKGNLFFITTIFITFLVSFGIMWFGGEYGCLRFSILLMISFLAVCILIVLCLWLGYLLRFDSFMFGHGIAILLGGIISSIPYLITRSQSHDYKPYTLDDIRLWSASPETFFIPSRFHPLWGQWIESHSFLDIQWIEHTLYISIVAFVLMVISIFWRKNPHKKQTILCLWTLGIAFIGALGTDLHIHGQPVSNNPVWLPMYYLAKLPGINLMRVWTRFGIIVVVMVGVLAGIGAKRITQHRSRTWVSILILSLIIVDLAPGRLVTSTIAPRSIDLWLANQSGTFAVGFLPAGKDMFPTLYGSLWHHQTFPAFNHGQHITQSFLDFQNRTRGFPNDASILALRELGLRYLLIDLTGYNQETRKAIQTTLSTTSYGTVSSLDNWLIFEYKK
ncbi:MAG: hypothetical protein KAX40_00105 [Herpetosiphon sp.]|nr:hypothetical protein [Herpetosiphon sp.]